MMYLIWWSVLGLMFFFAGAVLLVVADAWWGCVRYRTMYFVGWTLLVVSGPVVWLWATLDALADRWG